MNIIAISMFFFRKNVTNVLPNPQITFLKSMEEDILSETGFGRLHVWYKVIAANITADRRSVNFHAGI